jgi:hypothetical protein
MPTGLDYEHSRRQRISLPRAPQRACLTIGCPTLVDRGRCPACTKQAYRGSSTQQGYTSAWDRFRTETFPSLLIRANIVPMCGAVLIGGPVTKDSRCKQLGRYTFNSGNESLHLDHEPPLSVTERADTKAVCDPMRVQYLCKSCHSVKTRRERTQ